MTVSPEWASLLNNAAEVDQRSQQQEQAKKLGISPAQFDFLNSPERQAAAQQSAQEATQTSGQLFRNVLVPAGQAALTIAAPEVRGLGLLGDVLRSAPGQALLNAGVEWGLQKTGLNPQSDTQIGLQAAIPFASKVVEGVKGAGRAAANLMGRGQTAGEQAAAQRMGVPISAYERGVTPKPSAAAYAAAEGQGALDVSGAKDVVQKALDQEMSLGSQANKKTVDYLQGIINDLERSATTGNQEDAKLLVAKAQRLGGKAKEAFAHQESTGAIPLKEAAAGFEKTIPGMEKANQLYTREDVVDKVFNAMRSSDKVGALDKLVQEEGSKIGQVMSKKEFDDLKLIASRIEDFGQSGGMFVKGYETGLRSFLADPNGLTVFRHAFGPTMERLKPERLAGIMTFVRGYLAQKGRNGNNQVQ